MMKFFALLLLSCALVLASGNDVVGEYMNMEQDSNNYVLDDETEMILDLINRPITPSRYKAKDFFETWGKESRVEAFSWSDCGGEGSTILGVTVNPDPLTFPGSITIGFKININTTIDAPLNGELLLEKSIAGHFIQVPCIDNFGSCTYESLCDLLQPVECPDEFNKAGVPCKCPFKTGSYNLPSFEFDIDANVIPSGDYKVTGKAVVSGKTMACLALNLTVGE